MPSPTTRATLRRRAAVLVDFDVDQVAGPAEETDDVLDFLDEDCLRVPVPGGPSRWTLTDTLRTQVLTTSRPALLRAERRKMTAVPPTGVQQALDQSLSRGWRPDEAAALELDAAGSVAVVAKWWAGYSTRVPDAAEMTRQVERLGLFADARAMSQDHFVGREDVLGRLRTHLTTHEQRPILLWGLGGIGKSAVLAKHVVAALDEHGASVVVLDFDDATLNPIYLAELCKGIIDILSRQAPPQLAAALAALQQASADEASYGNYRLESSQKDTRSLDVEWARTLAEGLSLVTNAVLLVFDTVEQVQRRGPSAVISLQTLIGELAAHPHVSVVLSGRARLPQLVVTEHHLVGLDPEQAIELMVDVSGQAVDRTKARALVELFGTSPLTIRLIAALLAKTEGEPGDLFDLRAANEQLDAELYLRLLGHITDEPVRRLAHPGLVLRRITSDIIRRVLAEPCGVPIRDDAEARSMMARLAAEPMLVDATEPDLLVHRQDVRAVMLPQLLRDPKVDVGAVQLAAVDYYSARTDLDSRVEELYHRLLLAQAATTLDERWDNRATDLLITSVDELPQASRVYLLRKMPDRFLSAQDRALVDEAQWVAEVEPEILRLHSAGDAARALQLLHERRAPDGSSLLPALEIETLETLGRLDEAGQAARNAMRAAAARFDAAGVATFALQDARLLERSGSPEQAQRVLDEALDVVEGQAVHRLRLLVAWLGLARRHGIPEPGALAAHRDETARVTRALGPRAVADVPGLLRDVAAEVGEDEPDLLTTALGTVGLDALATGSVPQELEALAEATDRRGALIDLMQMPVGRTDIPAGGIDFREVVNQPRGLTGRALVEVLSVFGDTAAGLRAAVTADYQRESDAVLTGESLADERHWSPSP